MTGREARVRCLIVDRSPVFAVGLTTVLEDGGSEVLAVARTPADGIALARSLHVDLVIVGLEPLDEALEFAETIRGTPVLVLASTLEQPDVIDALRRGIGGIVPKEASPADLMQAVWQVPSGYLVYPKGWVSGVRDPRSTGGTHATSGAALFQKLTPREQQIVGLIAQGKSNKQVAQRLGIAHQTAKNHLAHIMAKLHVSSRLGLLRWAIDHEVVDAADRDDAVEAGQGRRDE